MSTPGYPNPAEARSFLRDAFAWQTSVTPRVLPRIAFFGFAALVVGLVYRLRPWDDIAISHLQYTGGVLLILLVLRTNASYDRWWEGRKLWGGIVNQSRNLAIGALAHGPRDPSWRRAVVRATAAFPHAARRALRAERDAPEVSALLEEARVEVSNAEHLPSAIAHHIASLLHQARASGDLDALAFHGLERERAALIDHVGACERILRTPLPLVHKVKLRRFIMLYLLAIPFVIAGTGLLATVGITMLVAYPLLAIDQMAQELESPFSSVSLSHLPLERICATIEGNLDALLAADGAGSAREPARAPR
jgi:ion channel-forming bestrophin family protein